LLERVIGSSKSIIDWSLVTVCDLSVEWNKNLQQTAIKVNNYFSQWDIKIASTETKTPAYQSLVRSQLEYVATVGSPWQSQNNKKIQCCAARYVSNNYSPYKCNTASANTWLGIFGMPSYQCQIIDVL